MIEIKPKPFTFAPVTIIEGEQRSGKTETAITRVVDKTFANLTSVKMPTGLVVKAEPVLNKNGYPVIGHGRLWLPHQEPRIIKFPPGSCAIAESVKIIYNGHLYGIRYAHMEFRSILQHLNDGTIRDCDVIVDEAYIPGDRRDSLNPLVKTISKLGWQIGKRHIYFTMCLPDSSVLDLRFQKIETEHIVCSYDDTAKRITMFIRNRKKYKRPREVSYYAPTYWKYFWTDETFEIPEVQMERAMAMAE
jgi:hypothetical protein